MKEFIGIWPVVVIVLLLIVSLILGRDRKRSGVVNHINETQLPDEGLSSKEKTAFKNNKS